jgi:hypothetical protein
MASLKKLYVSPILISYLVFLAITLIVIITLSVRYNSGSTISNELNNFPDYSEPLTRTIKSNPKPRLNQNMNSAYRSSNSYVNPNPIPRN